MAAMEGKLVVCDRCNKSIFLKLLGTEDLDGGYSRYNKFEPLPEEWMHESEIGYLCPECADIFKTFIKDFMGARAIAPAWRKKEEQ